VCLGGMCKRSSERDRPTLIQIFPKAETRTFWISIRAMTLVVQELKHGNIFTWHLTWTIWGAYRWIFVICVILNILIGAFVYMCTCSKPLWHMPQNTKCWGKNRLPGHLSDTSRNKSQLTTNLLLAQCKERILQSPTILSMFINPCSRSSYSVLSPQNSNADQNEFRVVPFPLSL